MKRNYPSLYIWAFESAELRKHINKHLRKSKKISVKHFINRIFRKKEKDFLAEFIIGLKYKSYRDGYDFARMRREISYQYDKLRKEKNDYRFITRHTVLGRMMEIKTLMFWELGRNHLYYESLLKLSYKKIISIIFNEFFKKP